MSGVLALEQIDAVDAFARSLYQRVKQSGAAFVDVASAVRCLHLALRHLRVEAADPDSLLNRPDVTVYARQLKPVVEDSDFTLSQLAALLDKYGHGKSVDDEQTRDERVEVMRTKLISGKTNIDMFLDTVQLHASAAQPDRVVNNGSQPSLEGIKDKVDEIASRLFRRSDGKGLVEDEDGLWQEFKAELEKQGFSPQVLRKHKDVLRAYIRELESMSNLNDQTYPSIRGLLEHEARSRPTSPKQNKSPDDGDKFFVGIKGGGHRSQQTPDKPFYSSSEDSASDVSDSMALISTKDLVALDNLNTGMAGLRLQPPQHYTFSHSAPSQRYLPSNVVGCLPGPSESAELSASPIQQFGASPRFVPPIAQQPPPIGAGRSSSRLAPDRYGNEIPVEAQWTKIKRTLVSPEVLERAGVRYEARPEYVAVLGRLTREEISEYARQSTAARAARGYPRRKEDRNHRRRSRSDSRSSDEDDDSDRWGESDSTDADDDKTSEKGTKSYLHVVDPPQKKTSPSSTVQPKPILKNKNENHVRFDPEPHEVDAKPHSLKDSRDYPRQHERPPPPGFRRYRDNPRRHSDTYDRRRDDRGDRYGGNASEYYHDSRSSNSNSNGRRYHRDRKGSRKDDRSTRKKAWGETLGAVSLGGAAATLISVLAEAAVV